MLQRHTFGDYLQNLPRQHTKLTHKQGLPAPIVVFSDGMDVKTLVVQALKELGAVDVKSAVYTSDIVCKVVYGRTDFVFSRTDPNFQTYLLWQERIHDVLRSLHNERIVVFGFRNIFENYEQCYIELNPPSTRKSFGQFMGHGEMWED